VPRFSDSKSRLKKVIHLKLSIGTSLYVAALCGGGGGAQNQNDDSELWLACLCQSHQAGLLDASKIYAKVK